MIVTRSSVSGVLVWQSLSFARARVRLGFGLRLGANHWI